MELADAMALCNNNNNWMNNPFMYLVWMCLFGGDGFGWNRRNNEGLTQAELQAGFNNQDVMRGLEGIKNGICDAAYAANTTALQGFNGVQRDICSGFGNTERSLNAVGYQLGSQLAENRYAQQNCCCETQKAIANVSAENYKNTCDITTAVHSEGEATRAMIAANQLQELRDRLADRDRDLQTANFQLSQQAQNAALISALRPFPQPAYITTSPYQSVHSGIYNGCGCSVSV